METHLIEVQRGTPARIIAATIEHGMLTCGQRRITHRLGLFRGADGSRCIVLPTEVSAYDVCNLIAWLHSPPKFAEISGAAGWFRGEHAITFAIPDASNESGDTLVGIRSDGIPVSIYLPDLAVTRASSVGLDFRAAPEVRSAGVSWFDYETEVADGMNPGLELLDETSSS